MKESPAPGGTAPHTVAIIRRALLVILLLGLLGILAELLLLGHTEGAWQISPIALIAAALAVLPWYSASKSPASLHALRGVMALMLLSGVVGVWLHFDANIEWERESNPSLGGMPLYRAALSGAMPVLAPGAMIQLALLGLAFTYRHPALSGTTRSTSTFTESS
jgi:hypothetical protein